MVEKVSNAMPNSRLVFISHSSKDKNIADAICNWLEKESVRCWIAPRDILPGVNYGESIINAIQKCQIMIVVFTSNANDSKFVNKEVERAISKGAIVIPVRLQEILPSKSMEFFLSSSHWLDALTPPIEAHLDILTDTVKVLLKGSIPFNAKPLPLSKEADKEDISLFNELAPDDWYGTPKNKISKWIKNIFTDKS